MEQTKNTTIYALIARKGGVTKSTLTGNIGAALADMGLRVVLVESDGQSSLSKLCGVQPRNSFYDLIAEDAEFSDRNVMQRVPREFAGDNGEIWIIPSSDQQMKLASWRETGTRIYNRFQELRGWADVVLVDTSPNIDEINNAWFYTADRLILPTLCERLSIDHLREKTMAYIESARAKGEEVGIPAATVHGIVPNRYDKATNVDRVNIGVLQGRHGDDTRIFPLICNAAIWKTASQMSMSISTLKKTRENDNWRQQAKAAYKELLPIVESMTEAAV